MAKDCPDKPPMTCNNCKQDGTRRGSFNGFSLGMQMTENANFEIGHVAAECQNARKIDRSGVAEVQAEVAWAKLVHAIKNRDMDGVKESVQEYVKNEPETTYGQLEMAFRAQKLNLYLIAMESPSLLPTHTNMDLQGNLDKKYRINYRWANKPNRPREADSWPQSAEENMGRLLDAGETVERGLPLCTNCNELGHIAKRCPQEAIEKERVVIKCYNCDQEGHRVRDCESGRHLLISLLADQDQARSPARASTDAGTAGMSL
ncbi:hypothetical protein GGR52DRAFT_111506 [Hypoxylon sp. FL1284]|nr:hypothetical protein GGR52DRAFT_111506 [Hypoxylon sp. FL1284]